MVPKPTADGGEVINGTASPFDLRSVTIVVSGYPPVLATAVFREGILLARVQGAPVELGRNMRFMMGASPGMTVWGGQRCQLCLRVIKVSPENEELQERLGFKEYCLACVEPLANRCIRHNGRLPVRGVEFYCRHCDGIVPLGQINSVAGRRRLLCRKCRIGQMRRYPSRALAGART